MAFWRPSTRRASKGLTAATALVDLGRGSAWSTWRFGNYDWQIESWRLYDVIGEAHFLAGWIGDSVSKCRLYVTQLDEVGEATGEVEDQQIAQMAAVPLGTGSQRDDNLRLLGIDLAVAGEGWVVGEGALTNKPTGWFVVSGSQIRREGGAILIERPLQLGGKVLSLTDGKDLLIRAWRPHPNAILQSDSPMRAAIPILREIELITKREFAELESRLTSAGVWFLPEGLDFPRGEGDPEGITGFLALLQRIASANIHDQANASALVPILATIPDSLLEYLDKFKDPTTFASPMSPELTEKKERAIRRLGATFEVPGEILTGLGDSNHWSSWAIGEEGIKALQPYLATIADTLTRGFLIPTLQRHGIQDPEQYAYAFDISPLAARPNRHTEALALWDRYLISDEVAATSSAFDPDQMPTGPEKLNMLIFRSVVAKPDLLADPGIQAALGLGDVLSAPAAEEQKQIEETPPPAEDENDIPDTLEEGPPDKKTPSGPGYSLDVDPLYLQISGALAAATHIQAVAAAPVPTQDPHDLHQFVANTLALRGLEVAGNRLVTGAERQRRWSTVPRYELHVRVGPLPPERIERTLSGVWEGVDALVAGTGLEADRMVGLVEPYLRDLLERGIPHTPELLAAALMAEATP